jgi:hypothetical protein
LTDPIILQYLEARQFIGATHLNAPEPDRFLWRWTASGQFTSKSAYNVMFVGETSILGVKELRKSWAPNKCRFFIWLSLLGRSWTWDKLFRHGIRSDDTCALCSRRSTICSANAFSVARFGSTLFRELAGTSWLRRWRTSSLPSGFRCISEFLSITVQPLIPL